MNKAAPSNSVAARFTAAAHTYDELSEIQRTVAERLMAGMANSASMDRILEIGCGTGTLTELLRRGFPDAEMHAVDVSRTMLELAQKRLGNRNGISWYVADARQFGFNGQFPLIASSSALHWMTPIADTMKRLEGLLRPGGRLFSSLMVKGTFPELHASRLRVAPTKPSCITLPDIEEVFHAIWKAGLTLESTRQEFLRTRHASAGAFLRSLNRQGVTGSTSTGCRLLNRTELSRLINDYEQHFACDTTGVYATYRVLYVKVGKRER